MLGTRRNAPKTESENTEEAEDASFVLMDICAKAAYIMNKQAEGANLSKLNINDFYKWLEQFEADTFLNDDVLMEGVFSVLFDDMEESSEVKNS